MLFSKEKWNDAAEIKQFLKASSALSFDTCESSFQQAEDRYLLPIFGFALVSLFNSDYQIASPSSLKPGDVLYELQGAVANLAFYDNFDEFQTRLTDQGIQRQETEKFKQAYRYQEVAMQRLYLNRGLNYLEKAIQALDHTTKYFPEWHETEYYIARKTLVVRSPKEISDIYFINNSSIIYMRLMPYIRQITEIELPKVIGKDLFKEFVHSMESGKNIIGNNNSITTDEFRLSCAKYVIFKSLAKLIRDTGSITDRGLYFDSVKATTPNPNEETPASRSQIAALASQFDDSSYKYSNSLQDIVQTCFPDYFHGHESDVYQRDNRNKKMVWL